MKYHKEHVDREEACTTICNGKWNKKNRQRSLGFFINDETGASIRKIPWIRKKTRRRKRKPNDKTFQRFSLSPHVHVFIFFSVFFWNNAFVLFNLFWRLQVNVLHLCFRKSVLKIVLPNPAWLVIPLRPSSDQHLISPHNIIMSSNKQILRLKAINL